MDFERLLIPDVILLRPRVYSDDRGFFCESFRKSRFEEICGPYSFVQDNHSRSDQGVLRGLHYQSPRSQGKLIQVVRGEIYDVAVDLRGGSASFGQWVSRRISSREHEMLWIPPGFAHGFYVLSVSADVVYKCTDYYVAGFDYSIRWDDPWLDIKWPLLDRAPKVSKKDGAGIAFAEVEPLV